MPDRRSFISALLAVPAAIKSLLGFGPAPSTLATLIGPTAPKTCFVSVIWADWMEVDKKRVMKNDREFVLSALAKQFPGMTVLFNDWNGYNSPFWPIFQPPHSFAYGVTVMSVPRGILLYRDSPSDLLDEAPAEEYWTLDAGGGFHQLPRHIDSNHRNWRGPTEKIRFGSKVSRGQPAS